MDKTLVCQDCGDSFTFTDEDQRYHTEKGYTEPKRCANCRAARRANSGGGSSFGGGSRGGYGGGGGRSPREMFPATCAQCGKETEVPFRPSGDRPVYCSDCFSKRPSSSGGGGGGGRRSSW